jgi:hypothetical protein
VIHMKADLERKAVMRRSAHSYYEHRSHIVSVVVTAFSIILPAIIAFIAFTDISFVKAYLPWIDINDLRMAMGFGSLALFLLAVFDQIFQITTRHNEHRRAIELYSQLLMDIRSANIGSVSAKESNIRMEQFNQRYLQIASNTLSFTEGRFARAEKAYLKKRALRQARKELVFAWPWKIRRRAKAIAQNLYEKEEQREIDSKRNK